MDTRGIGLSWLAAGGVTVALAAATCLGVRRRFPSPWRDYALGAAGWAASVALKVVGAAVLFGALWFVWGEAIPPAVELVAVGLLTGVFECGVTLLIVVGTLLRRASRNSALAFGVAFGRRVVERFPVEATPSGSQMPSPQR